MSLIPSSMQAPAEVVAERLAACQPCEHRAQLPVVGSDYCKACGCPLANKTQLRNATCPKGKWGKQ